MSDIFENDIDEDVNLSTLEDGENSEQTEEFVFDTPLYV